MKQNFNLMYKKLQEWNDHACNSEYTEFFYAYWTNLGAKGLMRYVKFRNKIKRMNAEHSIPASILNKG
jgi:hypothetical protein